MPCQQRIWPRALRAIDEDVRQEVAAGDLSAAGDFDLTDEEASLLRGAADDYPEVAASRSTSSSRVKASATAPSGRRQDLRQAESQSLLRRCNGVPAGRKDLTGTAVGAEVWAALGVALRREAGASDGPLIELVGGGRRPSDRCVRDFLGEAAFDALPSGGVLELDAGGTEVVCRLRMLSSPEFVVAAPDAEPRPDMVYVGPDSSLLVEGRVAPCAIR